MLRAVVVYHSAQGHTRLVAETLAEGLTTALAASGSVELLTADDAAATFEAAEGRQRSLDRADLIVFGTATLMGGPSAAFKRFAEASSRAWVQRRWVGKLAAGFTNSGGLHGDKQTTVLYLVTLAAQHGMVWIPMSDVGPTTIGSYGGRPSDVNRIGASIGLMTQADAVAPDAALSSGDLETARRFGAHLGATARRLLGDGAAQRSWTASRRQREQERGHVGPADD